MAADAFNSLGGYTVGIPAVAVVDENGIVIGNVSTAGSVRSATIFTNNLRYQNGSPYIFAVSAAGNSTQIQYNNNGALAANSTFTFDDTTGELTSPSLTLTTSANLGNVGNITIGGGSSGYFLQTDGAGNLTWAIGGGGNGTPGGSNTSVQFNDGGVFNGESSFTYNKNTNTLNIENIGAATGIFTSTVTVNGNLTTNFGNSLRVLGNLNAATSANISLGDVSNVHITGGLNGYVLSTDGAGNLAWTAGGGGGGNGTPGGSNTQIQFNNLGAFGGSPYFTYNDGTKTATISGNLVANTFQIGAGIYHFCTSTVYFATTASTTPNQVLWSIPIEFVSSVDFTIISTDATGGTRQTAKISSTFYNGVVAYNEYAGLQINGGVGSFSVAYDPGGILNPPSIQLLVSPDSPNLTNYKMLIVEYAV